MVYSVTAKLKGYVIHIDVTLIFKGKFESTPALIPFGIANLNELQVAFVLII
jgi:hypothetical protein